MAGSEARLRPNSGEVAANVIDGEAVLINLSNGNYYSMTGIGGAVWELIAAGGNTEEIIAEVHRRYAVSLEQARRDVGGLVDLLVKERLVLTSEGADSPTPSAERPAAPATRMPYEAPHLERYTDMGDLLALDPPMPGLDDIPWAGDERRPDPGRDR